MKKFIIAAAVAAVGSAFAVESANVVGVNSFDAGTDYNYFAPHFLEVGSTSIDINTITLDDGGAGTVGWGDTMVISGPLGNAVQLYYYYDGSMNPDESGNPYWGDIEMAPVTVSFEPGDGVAIDNANGLTFAIKCVGQVGTENVSFAAVGDYNYTGNPYPNALDINKVTLDDDGAGTVGWGDTMVISGPLGNAIQLYYYYDGSMNPDESGNPYWGDIEMAPVTVSFDPGQGFAIDNANGLTFNINIACPYTL